MIQALYWLDLDICQENHAYDAVRVALEETRKRVDLPHSFMREYEQNFGDSYEELPKQPICRNRNLSYIFMEEGSMTGIMDFELPEYSIRLFDPCYAAAMKAELKQGERKFASGGSVFYIARKFLWQKIRCALHKALLPHADMKLCSVTYILWKNAAEPGETECGTKNIWDGLRREY